MSMGAEMALDRMIDYNCQLLDAERGLWFTADGNEVSIKNMTTKHIKNCLRIMASREDDISEVYKEAMTKELVQRGEL